MSNLDPDRHAFVSFCRSYRIAAPFFAALDLNLFDLIPNGGSEANELATRMGMPVENLRILLRALASLNILSVGGDRFFIHPKMLRFLRRGPDYLGDFARLAKRENTHWSHAAEILLGSYAGPPFEPETLAPGVVDQTLKNIEHSNRSAADAICARIEGRLPESGRAIDVGGGHGYYADWLLRRAPGLQVVIYDLPVVAEYCKARYQASPHLSRMEFIGGDALQLAFDEQFDIVLINDVLAYFNRQEKAEVMRRALRALKLGGLLVMSKHTLQDSGCTPARGALFSLTIFVTTGKGFVETDSEAAELLETIGFCDVEVLILADDRSLLTARRPLVDRTATSTLTGKGDG